MRGFRSPETLTLQKTVLKKENQTRNLRGEIKKTQTQKLSRKTRHEIMR